MKRKQLIIGIICLVVCSLIGFTGTFFFAKNALDSYYSRQLINAIRNDDKFETLRILERRPSCVNAPNTCLYPELYTLSTEYYVDYPLLEACSKGNIEIISILIEAGANVNCSNNGGENPLFFTYRVKPDNWYEISLILIDHGASIDYGNHYTRRTEKKVAIFIDIVQVGSWDKYSPEEKEKVISAFNYALENCDPNNVDWSRVLKESASNGIIEIVKFLLDEGYCDVNDTSYYDTALISAAVHSTPEMVQLLLDYGADKTFVDNYGMTAYDYAVKFEKDDIAALLKDN